MSSHPQTLITNALCINEGQQFYADILLKNDRIEKISTQITAPSHTTIIDANGRYVMPGMIDDQVHFREPGLTHKGDMATESAAAVAGGITSFMDMPNTQPATLNAEALEDKYQLAKGRAWANFGFYLGASNTNLSDIQALNPLLSPGIKVFMGASTGNMLVDNPTILERIFADAPTPIITHCEDTPTIDRNMAVFQARYGEDIPPEFHPDIRSREACLASTQLAIGLAKQHQTRLHVLHISTADELALFEVGDLRNKKITAETCVHFLYFDRNDYSRLGHLIKCNPAIKDASDKEALIKALIEDRIDILATDHAPHSWEEKQNPYTRAPSGLPLVQFALVSALQLVYQDKLTRSQVVQKFAHAPALLFDVKERGFLREGYFADLVMVEDTPFTVKREDVLSKCGWSPFEGDTFNSRIASTWVNGQLVWDGKHLINQPAGQRLLFDR